MLASFFFFLCGEFLLHIPCCLRFYAGSFSYTSRAVLIFYLIFMQRVSLTHPCSHFFLFYFLYLFYLRNFSYTSRAGFFFFLSFFFSIRGVSLTHTMLALILSRVFLLHIPCWLHFYQGSFSYTSRAGFIFFFFLNLWSFSYTSHTCFIFLWGVSLTHPVLASFLSGEFLLHIRCWRLSFFLGTFSYLSRADFIFIWGVSLTQPMLVLFCSGEILLHLLRSYRAFFSFFFFFFFPPSFFNLESSSSTSMLASFLSGEFLLHIPCWFQFYLGSFSYTSHAGFIFIWPVSLTHPMLQLHAAFFIFLSGSFFYTSHADFVFMWGVSLTHPVLPSFLCGEFLLHIPSCFDFYAGSFSYTSHACTYFFFFFFQIFFI